MIAAEDIEKVERLIKLSETAALIPEEFIPWETEERKDEVFMPDIIVSLEGHPLYNTLTAEQKKELARNEVAQVMSSYAWSEGLACYIFNTRILTLAPDSIEYRYLIKELIEEFRHQNMFSKIIQKLKVSPVPPTPLHRFIASWHIKLSSPSYLFMSVLAIELVTDVYGKYIRKDETVFAPLRKVSELHNIEEGRHIHYTKLWLKYYTENAGFFKRTIYSLIVLANIYFMRSLYVRKEIFERIGVKDPAEYASAARKNLKEKFGTKCLYDIIPFVEGFKGFNFITRPLWRRVLNASV